MDMYQQRRQCKHIPQHETSNQAFDGSASHMSRQAQPLLKHVPLEGLYVSKDNSPRRNSWSLTARLCENPCGPAMRKLEPDSCS